MLLVVTAAMAASLDLAFSFFPLYVPHAGSVETAYGEHEYNSPEESGTHSKGIIFGAARGFLLWFGSLDKDVRDSINAGATSIIAIFTGVLCLATYFQYRGVMASVRVAEKAADALPLIERAWIFPAAVDYAGTSDTPFKLRVRFRNIGRTPGVVKEVRVKFCRELPAVPEWSNSQWQPFDWALPPGRRGFSREFTSNLNGPQFCFAYVRYTDLILHKEHRSRFAVQWFPDKEGDDRITPAGAEAYNSYD